MSADTDTSRSLPTFRSGFLITGGSLVAAGAGAAAWQNGVSAHDTAGT